MVPEAVVFMDHWPRLPTGKIDRRGLPDPETPAIIRKEIPRTPIETIIAGAFADVLGVTINNLKKPEKSFVQIMTSKGKGSSQRIDKPPYKTTSAI